ncbi:phosphotransferase enzyme family protein [Microlunatus soli]|uniref:Homoserine kinase type II n=1 Tax=Microlunatus soli TaxID=630515 RepID=A0A1H1YAW3_9ACTN|nr:phosphotransferase [Microlunatus soli]SDT18600.1 homoserine kinase type II [Microlunatus soli]
MIDDDPYERCLPTAELAVEIGHRYGLGRPDRWRDLGGSFTTNVLLEFGETARVARIHRDWTTPERLAALQGARRAIAAAGIPTVTPLPDPTGDTMITVDNGRLVELEPFVTWNRRMNTPDLLRVGFGALARVHDSLRTADLPAAADTVAYANHLSSADAAALTRAGAERMRSWQDPMLGDYPDAVVRHVDTVTALESELADVQRRQLVHGDFWDNNVLFADDQLAAVIDVDFMAERWRIDDLALTIWFFLLEPGRGLPDAGDRRMVRELLDRYDAATTEPLSRAERLALPLAVARQPAWSAGRWIRDLDDDGARKHAVAAVGELPVAQAVLQDLELWRQDLTAN